MIKKLSMCLTFFAFIACGDDESSTSPAQELSEISSSAKDSNQKESSSSVSDKAGSEQGKSSATNTEKSSSSSVLPKSSSSSAISSSAVQKSCHLYDKAPTVIGCEGKSKPSWKFLNPNVEYHCLVDERDGQFYATVKIGEQTWMAENLAYADEEKTPNLAGNHW